MKTVLLAIAFWLAVVIAMILIVIGFVHGIHMYIYDTPENASAFPPAQVQAAEGREIGGPPLPSVSAPAATIRPQKPPLSGANVTGGEVGFAPHPVASLAPALLLAAIDECWWRESRNGTDPNWRGVGSAGERGEYQLTPVFIADVERISGFVVDPLNNDQCRFGIFAWLTHYAPLVGAESVEELYQLVHLGPTGFREWKGK